MSTVDQTLSLQQDTPTTAGCQRIFIDTAAGSLAGRPGIDDGGTLFGFVCSLGALGAAAEDILDEPGGGVVGNVARGVAYLVGLPQADQPCCVDDAAS